MLTDSDKQHTDADKLPTDTDKPLTGAKNRLPVLKIWLTTLLAKHHKTETPLTDATDRRGLPVLSFVAEEKSHYFQDNLDLQHLNTYQNILILFETQY